MKQKRKIIFPIGLVILITLALIIGFLLFNKNKNNNKNSFIDGEDKTQPWQIKIIDGNIYKVHSFGENELLISKNDIKEEIIQNFVFVAVSPDRSKMCFVGQSFVPQWLYYAKTDGTDISQIGLGKNCNWSNNSKKFAYNNHTTDVSPVDVYVFDLATKEVKNYTNPTQSDSYIRSYDNPVWSDDDKKITSNFSSLKIDGTGEMDEGVSIIDILKGEIIDK